ncbi:MAG: hypothetical protein EKK61_05720 [Rickettsiales bacterium]|nr:MAG: hypothetical protein EKK61_05720 [Rickettsiales bacterium]
MSESSNRYSSNQDMEGRLLIQAMFDDRIRHTILPNLTEKMFNKGVELSIFNYFKTLSKDKIDDLNTFLLKIKSNLSDSDLEAVSRTYEVFKEYQSDDVEESIKSIRSIIVKKNLQEAITKNARGNDGTVQIDDAFCSSVKDIVELELSTEKTLYDFSNSEDISLINESLSGDTNSVMPSKFEVVNDCLNAGGYVSGDLICIAAASGTGKSTLALCEAAHFLKEGKKVLYVTLGDMKPQTTLLRLLSNLAEVGQKDARSSWYSLLNKNVEIVSNFRNLVLNAGEVPINMLLSKLDKISKSFKPDAIFIDYDANLLNIDNSHMYDYYGEVYTKLKMYGMTRDVIMFVLSQIKITEYSKEIIEKECLEGSSKKQNQLDLLLTLGKSPKSNKVGTLNLAKVRDGVSKYTRVALNHWKCDIEEITDDDYQAHISGSTSNFNPSSLFEGG